MTSLVAPADLSHLPGAPFTAQQVDAAVDALRREVGWHIAPQVTETVTLDVEDWARVLRLPSRFVVSVTEIRNADTDTVIPASRYRVSKDLARVRHSTGYWPAGYGAVEVDLTHGYAQCPRQLLPIIAQLAATTPRGQGITQEGSGPFTTTYSDGLSDEQSSTVARYVSAARAPWLSRP